MQVSQSLESKYSLWLNQLLGSSFMRPIFDAVSAVPITGNKLIDALLLYVTGILESNFRGPRIMPPLGESSALGYFQLVRATRSVVGRRLGLIWDDSMKTQAIYAAYVYRELYDMMRRGKIRVFNYNSDPMLNLLLNLRFRYVVGPSSKFFNHRDGLTAISKFSRYLFIFSLAMRRFLNK